MCEAVEVGARERGPVDAALGGGKVLALHHRASLSDQVEDRAVLATLQESSAAGLIAELVRVEAVYQDGTAFTSGCAVALEQGLVMLQNRLSRIIEDGEALGAEPGVGRRQVAQECVNVSVEKEGGLG